MSADNGYIIRKNNAGKFVLQMYFASEESYPDVEKAAANLQFDTMDDVLGFYTREQPYSEYGLQIDPNVFATDKQKKVKQNMKTKKFIRNPFVIEAVRVTEENFDEVQLWCNGQRHTDPKGKFIQVAVRYPLKERQTHAYVGDWVLASDRGFKVYSNSAFRNSFTEHEPVDPDTEALQELLTVDEPVDGAEKDNVFVQAEQLLHKHFPTVSPRDQISGKRAR